MVENQGKTTSLGALPGPGSTGSTMLGSGSPNGTSASEQATLRLGLRRTITRSYAHRAVVVGGRLLNEQGQPIRHATLDVLQQAVGTAMPQLLTHAKTGSDGTFRVRVSAGPSRLIEVAYRAFSSDASYAAIASIRETVQAGVRLSVSPTHTGAQGMIVLSGSVEGPIPQQGALVDLLSALPWPLGAVQDAPHERAWSFSRDLSVRGRRRALSVPCRSSRRSGRISFRKRQQPGGRCQHQLGRRALRC